MIFGPQSPTYRAILVLLFGILLLDSMGALVKSLLADYSAPELSAYRNVIGMVPSLVMLMLSGAFRGGAKRMVIRQWPLALSRGLFVALAQLCYYFALSHLEFATVAALTYTMSLFVVALSVPVLGERVGPFRWTAVLLGFAGAMWVVRPGSETFSLTAILPLIAALLYALASVTVRLIDRDVPNALLYLYSASASAVAALILAVLTTGFTPLHGAFDLVKIIAMGLLGGSGVLCLLISVRLVTPSVLAPFNYFGILTSFSIGWMFFGEAPIQRLFPGVVLIFAAGMLIIWREHQREKQR